MDVCEEHIMGIMRERDAGKPNTQTMIMPATIIQAGNQSPVRLEAIFGSALAHGHRRFLRGPPHLAAASR